MAMIIGETCINCGACESDCPNNAISEGDGVYVVDAALCKECAGVHEQPKCVELCPIDDCIVKAPGNLPA